LPPSPTPQANSEKFKLEKLVLYLIDIKYTGRDGIKHMHAKSIGRFDMSQAATKLPVNKVEQKKSRETSPLSAWQPFESLHHQIDRLFDDFGQGFWPAPSTRTAFNVEPIWRTETPWAAMPAVDVVEKEKAYEITAELPGLSERDIEVTLSNGTVTIRGEKKEEKEEEKQGFYLSERSYGSFARSFRVPEGADAGKIEANFKNGVLTVTLPKTAEAQKPEKKIAVKAA